VRSLVRHMKTGPLMHQLKILRGYLDHFDHSPDFGDGEAVAAIRRHLLTRIRELEGSIRCPDWSQPQAEAKNAIGIAEPFHSRAEAA